MGKINPALYTSERQDWESPPEVIEKLLGFIGRDRFHLDVCTTNKNIPAEEHFTILNNGLTAPWYGICFMNPPYNEVAKWVKRAHEVSQEGVEVWGLIPARPDNRYWHDYVFCQHGFVVFLKGRLHFVNPENPKAKNEGAPFPSALVYWGNYSKLLAKAWQSNPPLPGTVMVKNEGFAHAVA